MADPDNRFPDIVQFTQSPVFRYLLVSIISQGLAMFSHTTITTPQIDSFVTWLCQIIALVAAGIAAYKRWKSPIQPLSLKDPNK